jgi:hypothetical protein
MAKKWEGSAPDAEILRKLVLHGMRDIGVRKEKGGGIRTNKQKRDAARVGREFCRMMKPKMVPKRKVASKPKTPIDWEHRVMTFKKSKKRKIEITMGTPGSAQVTRVRLREKPYCRSLWITTNGRTLVIGKKK